LTPAVTQLAFPPSRGPIAYSLLTPPAPTFFSPASPPLVFSLHEKNVFMTRWSRVWNVLPLSCLDFRALLASHLKPAFHALDILRVSFNVIMSPFSFSHGRGFAFLTPGVFGGLFFLAFFPLFWLEVGRLPFSSTSLSIFVETYQSIWGMMTNGDLPNIVTIQTGTPSFPFMEGTLLCRTLHVSRSLLLQSSLPPEAGMECVCVVHFPAAVTPPCEFSRWNQPKTPHCTARSVGVFFQSPFLFFCFPVFPKALCYFLCTSMTELWNILFSGWQSGPADLLRFLFVRANNTPHPEMFAFPLRPILPPVAYLLDSPVCGSLEMAISGPLSFLFKFFLQQPCALSHVRHPWPAGVAFISVGLRCSFLFPSVFKRSLAPVCVLCFFRKPRRLF